MWLVGQNCKKLAIGVLWVGKRNARSRKKEWNHKPHTRYKAWNQKTADFVKYLWFLNFLTSNIEMLWHISSALFILTLKMSLILILGAKSADIFESLSKEEKIIHWLSQRKYTLFRNCWNCTLLVILDPSRPLF